MNTPQRPLSPHLQIYRLPLTAIISITHRITGVMLTFGLLVLIAYLLCIAAGPQTFVYAQTFIGSIIGQLLLFGFNFALCFHLCHGVRHLFWDCGKSFDLDTLHPIALFEIMAALLLTLFTWLIA